MMEALEKDIIVDCQAGNTKRFEALYDMYIRKIYNFIYFKTFHKETAEDLASDVFYKVIKNIKKFDTNRKFSPWIYKIAQNTVIDHFRTFRKEENLDDIWDVKNDYDITEKIDDRLVFEKARTHLKKLPSIQRDIVIMRIWQEMSYKEIAEIINKSEGNCKVIFSRAIAGLRAEMLILLLIMLTQNLK